MLTEDDKRLKYVPLEIITVPPPGLIEHFNNRYWCYVEGKGVMFWSERGHDSPQCNMKENVIKYMIETNYPFATCLFIPSAFRKINPQDYCS